MGGRLPKQEKTDGASPQSVEQSLWSSVKAFTEEVLEEAVSDKRTHPVPKRHLILHGKSDPAMWDEADCLRILQAISTIVFLRDQVLGAPVARATVGGGRRLP